MNGFWYNSINQETLLFDEELIFWPDADFTSRKYEIDIYNITISVVQTSKTIVGRISENWNEIFWDDGDMWIKKTPVN